MQAAEVSLGGLDRYVAEQKSDLFEFASIEVTQSSAGSPEVMRCNFLEASGRDSSVVLKRRATCPWLMWMAQAPVNLIYVADYRKMGKATPEDKAVTPAADTGFISQNVYLFCASEGISRRRVRFR